MIPIARLLALWFAVIWLPLTLHCELARAGGCDDESSCCAHHCGCRGGDCQSHACSIIETGHFVVNQQDLKAPHRACDAHYALLPSPDLRQPPAAVTRSESTGAPPGWIRVWQFVFRAAPAPRAPTAVC